MKSADAFRTISEVSDLLETPAHVLRFWESRFTQIRPIKRAGGRRYYRPGDVALLAGIKQLLHHDGLTIRGVQKILRERGVAHVSSLSPLKVMDAIGLAPRGSNADRPVPDDVLVDGELMIREPAAEGDEDDFDPEAEAFLAAAFDDTESDPDGVEPATTTAAAAPTQMPLWPATETPDVSAADPHLVPDPEEDEAPMQVNVPTLPHQGHGMVAAIGRVHGRSSEARSLPEDVPGPDEDATVETAVAPAAGSEVQPDTSLIDDDPVPAARMLRAMTALRARDHRVELIAVYDRARRLHDRLSESAELPPAAE